MAHSHPELRAPNTLEADSLRIVTLGGLGEVGRNMTLFEINNEIFIVDCGLLFPKEHQPGIDLILPDFDYLHERYHKIKGIFLTHGHEDHIGAIPHLLSYLPIKDVPLIGSRLTISLVSEKLKERKLTAPIRIVKEGETLKLGEYQLEFVAVNHSIPDALAALITTKAGSILITGDFKMDQLPLDNRKTDLVRMEEMGKTGIDLLMVDSTNADVPGFTVPEKDIKPALEKYITESKRRVIVASFSSHVHRVQQVLDIAVKTNRKVAFVGRSMVRNMGLAEELEYLHVKDGLLVEYKDIDKFGDEVILICTGSQGEPLSALYRMANGDHPIVVGPGDTVILASSLIPGNENSVFSIINELTRLGAKVVHKGNALVHVSGHAAAGELLYFFNTLKPKNLLPIHGEWRHLRACGELGIESGISRKNIFTIENGIVLDMKAGKIEVAGAIHVGYIFIDGPTIGEITEDSLKDRRILGEEGFISVILVVDSADGKIVAGPDIHARGFTEDDSLFGDVKAEIETALARAVASGANAAPQLEKVLRKTLGAWAGEKQRRKPMIVPVVVEI
jgi:ribonuclease J